MTDSKFQYSFKDMGINVSHIEALLGYDENGDRDIVQSLIEETLDEAAAICSIRAEYRIYKNLILDNRSRSISINNINFDIQKIVFNQLKKTESVAVFVCTAGEEIGRISREVMMGGDPLKGYILDVIGSIVVDAAADLMQDALAKSVIQSGQKITNRYSPGYCGWSVGEQHKLFQLIPDNFCGIKLTESALMDPVKSASGIIGIGEHVRYFKYTCSYCDMKDCTYRGLRDEKEEHRNRL
jgi:hypothetical protein